MTYVWRRELKKFQDEWTEWWSSNNDLRIRRPPFRIIRRPPLPRGMNPEDDTEIEWIADRLNCEERANRSLKKERNQLQKERDHLESKCRRLEQEKAAILAHSEQEYLKGRGPETHERVIRMLNENDSGGTLFL